MAEKRRGDRITIREMEIDDFPTVFHLGERVFTSAAYPVLYRTWDEWEITGYFQTDSRYCLVAEVERTEEVVGFALGSIVEKARSPWKYGYIAWLGVQPEMQRRRLGTQLYGAMERRMGEDGARIMMIDTDADNRRALSFFRGVGFAESRTHIWMTKAVPRHRRSTLAVRPRRTKKSEATGEGDGTQTL